MINIIMKMDNSETQQNFEDYKNLKQVRFYTSISQFLLIEADNISAELINIVL